MSGAPEEVSRAREQRIQRSFSDSQSPRTQTVVLQCDQVMIAWAAGLLEGEGSFGHKGSGTARNVTVNCHMTDRDVLEKLRSVLGVGNVNGPYRNGGQDKKWKPRFAYSSSGGAAYAVMKAILPFMGSRRAARIRGLMAGYDSVVDKVHEMEHVKSGAIERTTNLQEWAAQHGMCATSLYRTMNGDRTSCRGWRRRS